jgi:malonyl-CoA decarboxylase
MVMKLVSLKNLLSKLSNIGFDFPSMNKENSSASTTIGELCNALLGLKGEASSVAISEEILSFYRLSSGEEKLFFFQFLFDELTPDEHILDNAITAYQQTKNQQDLQALSKAAESPRRSLFRALNMAGEGTQSLISMREDLQPLLKSHPELKVIDLDFLHLFKSWFNRGFLELKRIDWQTPAEVLEKLIKYESVHAIKGWPDLRRRLADDRRCFGFFHPVMPNTPLIFVEVALTRGLSDNISALLNQESTFDDEDHKVNTAIFYSINNCFSGLRGVSFGNFLIKQVVEHLAINSPEITTYATLSPVPGYLPWLRKNLASLTTLSQEEQTQVKEYLDGTIGQNELMPTLLKLCAYYLFNAKKRDKPDDPVARFHLGNGAGLERINWEGNLTETGLKQSAGIMVNYLYDRNTLTRNHEAYEQNHKIACSNSVIKLLP